MTTFTIPVEVQIGPDSIEQLPQLIGKYGKKVLLVHGHRPVEDGLLETVRVLLSKAKICHFNMGEILPNPKYHSVKRGIEIARENQCDLILAVGGGSTLQCAKGIALGVPYKGDVWDFWSSGKTPSKVLPIGAILTNPASGDELNDTCTLVKDGKQKSFKSPSIRCTFAILDPTLSVLPAYPTMCQCFEMFVYSFSRYLASDGMEAQMDILIMKNLIASADALYKNPSDLEARNTLFWAGLLSHSIHQNDEISLSGLAQALAFKYSLTIGTAMSSLFGVWCQSLKKEYGDKMDALSQELFGKNAKQGLSQVVSRMHLAASLVDAGLEVEDDELRKLSSSKKEQALLMAANKAS